MIVEMNITYILAVTPDQHQYKPSNNTTFSYFDQLTRSLLASVFLLYSNFTFTKDMSVLSYWQQGRVKITNSLQLFDYF